MKKLGQYQYIEVKLDLQHSDQKKRALGTDFFVSCGVSSSDVVFFERKTVSYLAVYLHSFRRLQKIRVAFKKTKTKGFRLRYKILAREDWFDKWQQDYQIMPLGKRFTLVPLWQKKKFKGKKIPLYLDPKGVFGSGSHPTTRMMVTLMEQVNGKFESFLDLGTGTGILCLVGHHLGAKRILALDRESLCVKAAKFNLKQNGVKAERVWRDDIRTVKKIGSFDLVGSNVISNMLVAGKKSLFGHVKKGGYLIVSGIHVYNLASVRRDFQDKRFRCLRVLKYRGWVSLLFKRIY